MSTKKTRNLGRGAKQITGPRIVHFEYFSFSEDMGLCNSGITRPGTWPLFQDRSISSFLIHLLKIEKIWN